MSLKALVISISLVVPATGVFANSSSGAPQDPILKLSSAMTESEILQTRGDLLELPQHEIVTTSSVTDGPKAFEGFLILDLLENIGTHGDVVIARALNDYQIEIPIADFKRFDVIGALTMNGVPLSPRDKGPIWIVYPRDDYPELQDIRYDTRWVWQLVSLHVQ